MLAEFPEFSTDTDYLHYLEEVASLPAGFRVSTASLAFTPSERPTLEPYRMNLGLILADEPTPAFGGVFTRNAFPGAPVILGRQRMDEELIRGVLVNNKIANVRARTGLEDARRLTESLGAKLGTPPEQLFSVSTGIIGWRLPVAQMEECFPVLLNRMHDGSAADLASAIMTTDSFPKARSVAIGDGRLLGIVKGAGMIEPNMATMLVFLLTDIALDRDALRRSLATAAEASFNLITVDGDMSTSDMALLMSSGRCEGVGEKQFSDALAGLCQQLASDIVRNGEGTGHVIHVEVSGTRDNHEARAAAKAVANSPLVKTAIFGNDPNVGRILSAVGDFAGNSGIPVDPGEVVIRVGDETVFVDGAFEIDREKEIRLSEYLKSAAMNPRLRGYPQHQRTVELSVRWGAGPGRGEAIGSDLSDQYVRENADYRT
jgi:glutamate N-acetyltransferase/amino-acid N-acetyltransferase